MACFIASRKVIGNAGMKADVPQSQLYFQTIFYCPKYGTCVIFYIKLSSGTVTKAGALVTSFLRFLDHTQLDTTSRTPLND
jgi:hypothetical protein